jgi:hypothetical protein
MHLKTTFNAPADEQKTSVVKQGTTPSLAKRLPASALVLAALLTGTFSATHAYAGSSAFTVSSPDLASGTFDKKFTLNAFGCTGSNVSPSIKWSNLPTGTKSLALQVQDRDAPAGNSFWHWTVYNIPASATSLPQAQATLPMRCPRLHSTARMTFSTPARPGETATTAARVLPLAINHITMCSSFTLLLSTTSKPLAEFPKQVPQDFIRSS